MGPPVVFQAWETNQPAFKNSEERCVKMTTSQGTAYLLIYEYGGYSIIGGMCYWPLINLVQKMFLIYDQITVDTFDKLH